MNWLTAIIQALGAVLSSAIGRKTATPEPPAPPPDKPRGDAISAAENVRYEHDRAAHASSTLPVILPPRTPMPSEPDDRATDVGAMMGNGPPMDDDEPESIEPEPSTRRDL